MAPALSLQAKRWRTIIVTVPLIGATSRMHLLYYPVTLFLIHSELIVVLYERLVQGKPQRTLDGKNQVIPQIAPKPDATKEPVFSEER